MYRRILIATDGSALANKAVEHGVTLAKALNASVIVVTVTEAWSALDMGRAARHGDLNPIAQYEEITAAAAKEALDGAAKIAKAQGVACELMHVRDQHPAQGIITTAANKECDLIVMASHGRRGVGRVLLGSQANEVLTHSKVPALIVR